MDFKKENNIDGSSVRMAVDNPDHPDFKGVKVIKIPYRGPLSSHDGQKLYAGSDDYICQGVDYTFITGYASTLHSASVSWVTSGDGTFTNVSTLTPTYSPGPNDIINGTVDLSLISTGNNPCATDVDDMTLIINQAPSTGPINHW